MAFHDIQLPDAFQYGSQAGAGFATIIQQTASGHEFRISRQSQAVHRLSLRSELRSAAQAKDLKAFALARRGALHSFKVRDWSDYTSNADGETAPTYLDQIIALGDGATTLFQLVKRYEIGSYEYTRTIQLIETNTVAVGLNGVLQGSGYTVNSQGQLQFSTAPGVGVIVTAGFKFFVPVRFTSDVDAWTRLQPDAYNVWSLPALDCQEVLGEVEQPERWLNGSGKFHGYLTADVKMALNDGAFHIVGNNSGTTRKMFLPVPTYAPDGPALFTVYHLGGGSSVEIRDDTGTLLTTIAGTGGVIRIGLYRGSGLANWVAYS